MGLVKKNIDFLVKYRFLFSELVKKDFKKKYKRTMLGMFWSVLNPLLHFAVYFFVFGYMLGSRTPQFGVYLIIGQTFYGYFSGGTTACMRAFTSGSAIYTQMNVPKTIALYATMAQQMITVGISFVVVNVLAAIMSGITPYIGYVVLIYPFICMTLFVMGIGFILGTVYMFFRDLSYLYGLVTQMGMFVSGVFFTRDSINPKFRIILDVNPVYHYIAYFRSVIIDRTMPSMNENLLLLGIGVIAMVIGVAVYKKYNKVFFYYL
jgi:ABC-type polysaccharide/polyol phosphate export permease